MGKAKELKYLRGFGNHFRSEALEGALPEGQNNPQQCPYGLYAEQLSGTAFTVPRAHNQRTWLYRIHPSVQHSHMEPSSVGGLGQSKDEEPRTFEVDPNQMRWQPQHVPDKAEKEVSFLEGITQVAQAGSPHMKSGLAVHIYAFNSDMGHRVLTNADGDLLIVPQMGVLLVKTEMGIMRVEPSEICVIPRGIRFTVDLQDGDAARGYILEVFSGHFVIPDLGPIGSNGLANPWDFETPVAYFEDKQEEHIIYTKFAGKMFEMTQSFSPFNVVAYNGNYVPYKYDLRKFNCMNSVTYDHPDPSIYTVLTCQSNTPGVAVADFVIFPPRWMAMEHSFRPPWFHRNTMCEYMGLINGEYDAKKGGFVPGGSSLHNTMTPHGPDAETFKRFSDPNQVDTSKPEFFDKGLAFMFETTYVLELSKAALESPDRELTYQDCWQNMPNTFNPTAEEKKRACNQSSNLLAWRAESTDASNGAKKKRKTT